MVKRFAGVPMAALMAAMLGGLPAGSVAASDQPVVLSQGAESYGPVTPYVTVPLGSVAPERAWQPGDAVREIPRRKSTEGLKLEPSGVGNPDPLITTSDSTRAPNIGVDVNINGIGFTGAVPPDTVGDVGPNHFVQAVNASSVSVYDKQGNLLSGPIQMDSLAPAGDSCRNGGGDPIVLYDQLADRWFLQEFISGGNKLCIYISQTPDPTGAYYFYGFSTPAFPDYPHYGVWPDAYYGGTNEGSGNETTYAFDRQKMLAGQPATMQRLAAVPPMSAYGFQVLTPADHDGATPPPAGSPGLFVRHFDDEAHSGSSNPATDQLQIFAMDVDWNNPGNTTVTQLPPVTITDYNSWFINYTTFFSIPQPGSGTRLDPIREAVLNRLVYRNFGSHESLVGNFATNRNPATSGSAISAGIRWFELRRSGGGNWAVHQEGTFGGDSNSPTAQFFMGGIAMDSAGNIALGYSKTDTNAGAPVFPSIGVSGRLATDPAGVMAPEIIVAPGVQPSNQGGGRWGDYAAMGIDPADDCTFWYTNEYMPGSSWGTRITSFVFEECLFGFSLVVDPVEANVCAVTDPDPSYSISVDETGGWGDQVTLSATGLPPGTTAVFSSNGQQPPFVSTMTIEGIENADSGSYTIEITGTGSDSPATVRSAQVVLNLSMVEPAPPQLLAPADGAVAVALQPTLQWAAAADAIGYQVEVATDAAFATIVYSASASGTSHAIATPLQPGTGYWWRVLASNLCGATPSPEAHGFTTIGPRFTSTPVTSVDPLEEYSYAITVDADGAAVSIAATTLPDWLDLVDHGGGAATLSGTPEPDEVGPHPVVLTATSSGLTTTQAFTVTVEYVNFAPTFTSTPVTSGTRAQPYSYTVTATDLNPGTSLSFSAVGTLPGWLSLTSNPNGTATLSGTPGFADVGANAVTLQVSDGSLQDTQSFTIQVADVNVGPVFVSTPVTTAATGAPYLYEVVASDPNLGASLVIGVLDGIPLPSWLTLTDHGDGTATLSGTPGAQHVGTAYVVLTVSDGQVSSEQPFAITVSLVNQPPQFTSSPVGQAVIGQAYTYLVTTIDGEGDAVAISADGALPAWLTLVDNGDGTALLSGTPQAGDAGTEDIVLVAADASGQSEQAFTLEVVAEAIFSDGFEAP